LTPSLSDCVYFQDIWALKSRYKEFVLCANEGLSFYVLYGWHIVMFAGCVI